jgi:hypothetical protein
MFRDALGYHVGLRGATTDLFPLGGASRALQIPYRPDDRISKLSVYPLSDEALAATSCGAGHGPKVGRAS